MNDIVCATRGGQGSRAVRTRAIALAQATKLPILFLYVVDLHQLSNGDDVLAEALHQEATWLGRVMLEIARQQAGKAGVQAEVLIKTGLIGEELARILAERQAHCLLMGAPRHASSSVFGDDAIEQFAREIESQTGVSVEIVHPGMPAS
ncbi:MAG: universal stress protein [Anaerolineales bacterium]|nr:universal stress protein [Anaerolineales bacterium]